MRLANIFLAVGSAEVVLQIVENGLLSVRPIVTSLLLSVGFLLRMRAESRAQPALSFASTAVSFFTMISSFRGFIT